MKWQVFKQHLLSTSENADKCKILNKEVLQFDYDPKTNIMEAWAFEPLVIENKALGYVLHYDPPKSET